MDVSQYLEIFIDETKEHLQSLNEQILILEREPENVETINEIFRAAHSLKGMAGTMGYKRMQRLTHDMENVFSEIRNGKMKASAKLVDVLFKGLDALEQYLDVIINSGDEGTEDNEDIIKALNDILNEGIGGQTASAPAQAQTQTAAPAGTAAAVAPAQAAASESGVKPVNLAEHEKSAIAKALSEKLNAFTITVYVQETCILKAARAFLVFKALEELGTVIHSEPQVQDIEDEHFDFDFTVVLLTEADAETAKKKVENVSEIKMACVEVIHPESVVQPEAVSSGASAGNGAAAQKENTNQASAAATQQKSSKPVVNRSVRVDIDKLDDLMNLVSELIIAKNGLVSINTAEVTGLRESGFNEQIEYLERITTNLHQSVMKTRMVPIENVVSRFPRMIRDISKKLDKKMELYMSGEETELDRTVIDEIGDPLMHMLRNAADHGLESNEERIKAGKPEVGSIFLNAYQDGNNVVIEVRDDGRGVDVEKIKKKALEKGVITQEQATVMTEKEAIDLLFRPSFSTAEKISDLSGRGVGLDVVKSKIEALGGDVEAKTVLGAGTTFIVRLPLTLAIIQALMVELGQEKYAIPLGSIQTIEDVLLSDIKYVQTKEVIHLRGNVIPLIRLRNVLDVQPDDFAPESLTVVIVAKGDRLAGLVVDNLIGQQEIVIKSIGKYINNNKMIGGATILGDGEVALILDANAIV
ncbi:MAG: chemotaxis protein CheA [Lachnospiraceae bacterium]|nr:chemotaxis protein CheA [Lachnospiraceae bacterium]